VWAYCWMQYI